MKNKEQKETRFLVLENGPIKVTGNFRLYDKDKNPIEAGKDVYLCRCGNTSNPPFCDGTHVSLWGR